MKMPFDEEKNYEKYREDMLEIREKILGLGEKSLRKSYYPEFQNRKERLESLLRSAPIGAGIIIDDIMVEVNEVLCNMTMYSHEELIGNNMEKLFAAKRDYRYIKDRIFRDIIEKQSCIVETKWKQKDNKDLIVLLNCSSLDRRDISKGIAFTAIDITNRKRSEAILYFEKERLKITLESIADGVIATKKGGEVVLVNPIAEKLTGWTEEEAKGKKLKEIFKVVKGKTLMSHGESGVGLLNPSIDKDLTNYMLLFSKDGTERKISHNAAPIKNWQGKTQGVVLVFRDVTEEIKRQEEIIRLSYHDKLTGLYNRSYFEEAIKKLDSVEYLPLSIIMGDINGLKLTNDVFGHQEGDRLLQSVAKILLKFCGPQDIVARWGGDEFVILLPRTSYRNTKLIVEKINKECKINKDERIKTSISLGYTTKVEEKEDIMGLLKKAEDIMYQQKLLESHSLRSGIINSIKSTLHEKSYETEEHAERLKDIGKKIGIAMNLSEIQLHELELLAVLHDIGKIIIKDSILKKPGKLTEEEWAEMKKHPEIGYRIVQSVPELSQVAEYILTHHERWDGTGYPRGLKGEEIPLLSRIIAIADTYDVITTHRPYKKAMSKRVAIEEISRNAGTQFDPNIVEVFLSKVASQL